MQKVIVLEDGDTYGGMENSRIVKVYDEAALEDIEDFGDVPDDMASIEECGTLGEVEQLTRRTLRAWYAMDKRTENDRLGGNPQVIEMDAAVWDLALALGIAPVEEQGGKPDTDDQPTQCAGLSGECPNPPERNGYCFAHQAADSVLHDFVPDDYGFCRTCDKAAQDCNGTVEVLA